MSNEIRDELASRRRRQYLASIAAIAALLAIGFEDKLEAFGIPSTVVVLGGLFLVAGALAFSVWNWRCPSCGEYLGRSIRPQRCRHCGIDLGG